MPTAKKATPGLSIPVKKAEPVKPLIVEPTDVRPQMKMTSKELVAQVLQGHDALHPLAKDNAFAMELGESGLSEAMKTTRLFVNAIADTMFDSLKQAGESSLLTSQVPRYADNPTGYDLVAKQTFSMRALKHIANTTSACSARTLIRFSTRMICNFDVSDSLALNSGAIERLEQSQGYIQVKRDPKPDNPMLWSWLISVDGVPITRGKQLPLSKLITSLAKPLQMEEVVAGNSVQALVIELGKLQVTDKKYYWYLTNENISAQYVQFRKTKSTDSCMSKEPNYYDALDGSQHPMQAYDHSPDWRLMFISDKSPAEIADMLDESTATSYKYPFLTRCMVLPTELLETSNVSSIKTPFVFGKIYGLEKVVNYFFDGSSSGYNKNNNPLLTHLKNIGGGRIARIKIKGSKDKYLLPYFDQANQALIRTDEEGHWWVSTHSVHWKNLIKKPHHGVCSLWRGQYQYGSARSKEVFSKMHNTMIGHECYNIEMRETIIGDEPAYVANNYYCPIELSGQTGQTLVPTDWTTTYGNKRYLLSDCATAMDGKRFPNKVFTTSPDRYKLDPQFGAFDLHDVKHAQLFANLGLKA